MQSFIMNSHEVFIHIHQGCFAGTGAIVRLPQCQWSTPDGYGKISQCITTTKHSKAKTVCIFLGIYCIPLGFLRDQLTLCVYSIEHLFWAANYFSINIVRARQFVYHQLQRWPRQALFWYCEEMEHVICYPSWTAQTCSLYMWRFLNIRVTS